MSPSSEPAPWKVLHLEHESLPPHLLVKRRLDHSGYTIQLTDLSRIWSESLTKREIERRAIKSDCAIDPGDGEDQYDILLDKLRDTLAQEDGTSLSIKPATDKKAADGTLLLSLSAPLPSPLPDFTWEINLALGPPHDVADKLVTPLINHASSLQAQIRSLVHELQEKDRIISKITDRLESSGNDLTTVFPGVSNIKVSRKKSQREQLARHVRGLADFDEHEWRAKDAAGRDVAIMGPEELNGMLAELPTGKASKKDDADEDWWKQLGKEGVSTSKVGGVKPTAASAKKEAAAAVANGHSETEDEDVDVTNGDDDGEFQRQGTPPSLRHGDAAPPKEVSDDEDDEPQPPPTPADAKAKAKAKAVSSLPADDDESTEDEGDLDAPVRKSQSSQRSSQAKPRTATPETSASPPKKLGAIGGRKRTVSPDVESPPADVPASSSSAKPRRLGAIGGKSKASATPEPEPEAPSTKPRSKLGTIGGKSKASAPASPAPEPTSSAQSSSKPHKLGMIGGKKRETAVSASRAASEETVVSDVTRATPKPQPQPVKDATPLPEETEEQRANRKRNELKRQLEEKAKAPAKKKRKF